ncbi:hypothetical protein NM208_g1638 [Fusarium decemcellulare]|uniref:Uncharacterized protein n=2 Tax=Fusarium decemcellulare TaxID=57161 RepID=A0ACC1STU4_9HYPO|nr:hypothetical protein NM208_g2082 [Fusarium decemcellulare]KAJ3547183.1 hypothetical protein NM208_g1638 [Fusarium decemcellulare]
MLHSSLQSRKTALSLFQARPAQDKDPRFKKKLVGAASKKLKQEILKMYWKGVRDELTTILLSLHRWQTEPSFSEPLPDENVDGNNLVRGYKAFIKNVSVHPWFADKYRGQPPGDTVEDMLLATEPVGLWQKRALMLLQSAQFLDIDNLFEYRRPGIRLLNWNLPLWKRMSSPQLDLEIVKNRPSFYARRCSECHRPIRSSSYHHIQQETRVLCETCFRKSPDRETGQYRKRYKTCCLPSQLTHKEVAELCHCDDRHNDNEEGSEGSESRWPLGLEAKGRCWLFALNRQIADKKHRGTSETIIESKSTKEIEALGQKAVDKMNRSKKSTGGTEKLPNLNSETGYPLNFNTSRGKALSIEEVPLYLRSHKRNYPFGNVHVALRFGPLTFENGINGTNGVIISTRDPPQLQESEDAPSIRTSLELTEKNLETQTDSPKCSWTRTVYQRQRPRDTKRFKAMAKQIVGGAFCGFIDRNTELEIAEILIREADDLMLAGIKYKLRQDFIKSATDRVFKKVRDYLFSRVERYVESIVHCLLDPEVALHWDAKENSCQTFCDNIINTKTFGSLFAPYGSADFTPLYLMSFVCRSNDYIARGPGPKYNTPHGHVEEYLFKYRFGRHDESDIIDTLQEYWYDWGNFEGFLYPYQDIFPWDCTEGFEKNPHRCGDCDISEHVWAFPFDSFSLISLHLSRARHFYPQSAVPKKPCQNPGGDEKVTDLAEPQETPEAQGVMPDSEWFKNRLNLLMGQYSLLTGATAMAKCYSLRTAVSWIENEKADVYIDRIKLGGIVRAQPFSHHFENNEYYQYYVAEWTSLKLSDRIEQYEKQRDWRAQLGGGLQGLLRLTSRKKGTRWYVRGDGGGGGEGGSGEGGSGEGGSGGWSWPSWDLSGGGGGVDGGGGG